MNFLKFNILLLSILLSSCARVVICHREDFGFLEESKKEINHINVIENTLKNSATSHPNSGWEMYKYIVRNDTVKFMARRTSGMRCGGITDTMYLSFEVINPVSKFSFSNEQLKELNIFYFRYKFNYPRSGVRQGKKIERPISGTVKGELINGDHWKVEIDALLCVSDESYPDEIREGQDTIRLSFRETFSPIYHKPRSDSDVSQLRQKNLNTYQNKNPKDSAIINHFESANKDVPYIMSDCTGFLPADSIDGYNKPSQYNGSGENNQFMLDLFATLKKKNSANIFFSPYSISSALAMAYEGAKGKTAEEIAEVVYLPKRGSLRGNIARENYDRLNKKGAKYQLNTSNALWIQNNYLVPQFVSTIENYYRASVKKVDFITKTEDARKTINDWVGNKTNHKIKNLFTKGSLTKDTRLVLTNTIYFNGNWLKPFSENQTTQEDFNVGNGRIVKVPMMKKISGDTKYNYGETSDVQIIEMPYEGNDLSMLVFLPKKENISAFEKSFTLENIKALKSQLKQEDVKLFFPKFKFDIKYNLKEKLKEQGINLAFTDLADFSGINGKRGLRLQNVVHQAFVEVDEKGTEATAATGDVMVLTSVPQFKTFKANHPFLFIIQEKKNGHILFMGKVVDPSKTN